MSLLAAMHRKVPLTTLVRLNKYCRKTNPTWILQHVLVSHSGDASKLYIYIYYIPTASPWKSGLFNSKLLRHRRKCLQGIEPLEDVPIQLVEGDLVQWNDGKLWIFGASLCIKQVSRVGGWALFIYIYIYIYIHIYIYIYYMYTIYIYHTIYIYTICIVYIYILYVC